MARSQLQKPEIVLPGTEANKLLMAFNLIMKEEIRVYQSNFGKCDKTKGYLQGLDFAHQAIMRVI